MKNETVREDSVAVTSQEEFLTRAWTDPAFSARLDQDPKALLQEMGAEVPDDMTIKVVRDNDDVVYLHLPAPPGEGEVADADLAVAQGGATFTVFTPTTTTTWSVYATSAISVSVTVVVSVTTN